METLNVLNELKRKEYTCTICGPTLQNLDANIWQMVCNATTVNLCVSNPLSYIFTQTVPNPSESLDHILDLISNRANWDNWDCRVASVPLDTICIFNGEIMVDYRFFTR